ncbi:hypothetical protein ACFVXC_12160 [Streptomyces sp. NPDC058257]|uniref:hypothetical protein n=1 Tax=Streptomyces sp. NPDC058257 TaxID=3346409 RepID=UPI0036E872B0
MTRRARAHRYFAAALAAGVLAPALLTGCAQSVDPIERLGRKAAEKVPPPKPTSSPDCAPPAGPADAGHGHAAGETGPEPEPPEYAERCRDGRTTPSVPPRGTPLPAELP